MESKSYYNKENKRRYYYEHRRETVLQSRYGIGVEEYNLLEELQNNLCAICKTPPGNKRLDVDHCHVSGVVRGLLCNNCNRGLGHLKDDINNLKAAIDYLRRDISGKGGSCGV